MPKPFDCRPIAATLYFLPVTTRVPLKFGAETLRTVTCARVRLQVKDRDGREVEGWGETPLSVQWVWPSSLDYAERHDALRSFTQSLANAWAKHDVFGHPLETGYAFQQFALSERLQEFNDTERPGREPMPWLAALVCCSAFDLALHDAYGRLVDRPVYETYNEAFMNDDLARFLEPATGADVSFAGRFPAEFLRATRPDTLPVWHLVGGLDAVEPADLTGEEPDDGHPVLLRDWIRRDGLKCLKLKLRGNDAEWDLQRLVRVGEIAIEEGVDWLTTDFNCTVTDPAYVNEILDYVRDRHPRIYGMILYVEQPFPYDLDAFPIDVHGVSARKPLFLDESAHDWRHVRRGRELGWTGVALKTCKTQTGAILGACWARAHGMTLMVQDLTNPMLAQIPHVLLAAHVDTIMGVESNAMQFYPAASDIETVVHPGLYQRRNGALNLSTLRGPGFGYRLEEMKRDLPAPAIEAPRE